MKEKGFRRSLASIEESYDHLIRYLGLLGAALVAVMMLIVVYEVFMRYFLRSPTLWVAEVSEFLLVYCVFLEVAWVMRINGHIRIDLVYSRLSPKRQTILSITTTALSIFFCAVFTWLTWERAWKALKLSETSGGGLFSVPMFPILIILPLGSLLLTIQCIRDIRSNIIKLKLPRTDQSTNLNVEH